MHYKFVDLFIINIFFYTYLHNRRFFVNGPHHYLSKFSKRNCLFQIHVFLLSVAKSTSECMQIYLKYIIVTCTLLTTVEVKITPLSFLKKDYNEPKSGRHFDIHAKLNHILAEYRVQIPYAFQKTYLTSLKRSHSLWYQRKI